MKDLKIVKVKQRFERAGKMAFHKIDKRPHMEFLTDLLTVIEEMPVLPEKIKFFDIIAFVIGIATCVISYMWVYSNMLNFPYYIGTALIMIPGCQVGGFDI